MMEDLDEKTINVLKNLAQQVDRITKEELKNHDIVYHTIEARVFNTKSVGVQGDQRTYAYPASITIYKNGDFFWDNNFLSKLSTRITNEVKEVGRVLYDITNKPPGTIELE